MTSTEQPTSIDPLDRLLQVEPHTSLRTFANVLLMANGYTLPRLYGTDRLRLTPAHLALISFLSTPIEQREQRRREVLDPLDGTDWAPIISDLAERHLLAGAPDAARREAPDAADPARRSDIEHGPYAVLVTPFALHPVDGSFELVDRDGALIATFALEDLDALSSLVSPKEVAALAPATRRIVEQLDGTNVIAWLNAPSESADAMQIGERVRVREVERMHVLVEAMAEKEASLGRDRIEPALRLMRVFPVSQPLQNPNLALGMIYAYARQYKGGVLNERYELEPNWLVRRKNVRRLLEQNGPSIFLFSSYIWSSVENLALSKLIKEISPDSLTIHGGPDVPRYEADTERFLREHPHVDIAARNEGEVTVAEILESLDGVLLGGGKDRMRLAGVSGIAFLDGDRVVRTPDRERVPDLDSLPSPYTTGVFDVFGVAKAPAIILETNRGCPYGCTFCDWGSATLSRLRKFSLDRVFAEIDWLAEHEMPFVFIADANFGIFERDVEIAEYIAQKKMELGFPKYVQTSYAKNTVKHITRIVSALVGAGITNEGILSLQTTDPDTLDVVRRKNIKTQVYLDLAATFRREKLPLFTDLMVGLPGSTFGSFKNDLQFTIDHDVPARVYRTELLVNTPMNEPAYREEHQIVTESTMYYELEGAVNPRRQSMLLSTSSYTADDLRRSMRLRAVYAMAENYGVLRHVARFVRQAVGVREVDLYAELEQLAEKDERYPYLRWAFNTLPDAAIPPVSWARFFDDVERLVVDDLGVPEDSALRTVLTVQKALVPDRGRQFPERLELDHDYVSWFSQVVAARDAGGDWCDEVPALGTFGPGTFEVRDEADVCGRVIGGHMDLSFSGNWELTSPVSRAMPRQDFYT